MAKMVFPQYRKGRIGIEAFQGSILDHARKLGIEISSECGGAGTCGRCVVRIEKGEAGLAPKTAAEQRFDLGKNERLACQAEVVTRTDSPQDDVIQVFIRDIGTYTILSDTVEDRIVLNPFVYRRNGKVLWKGPEKEEVLSECTGKMYGLAIDVGTTTLVSQVLDLESGAKIATFTRRNPQASYGDDVISRAGYTMTHDGGLEELQRVVVRAINDGLKRIASDMDGSPRDIYEVVIVGNSTMRSIFFGIPVSSLGVMPFEPLTREHQNVKASQLGLEVHPKANVYGAGLIGGHAGADALADAVSSEMYQSEGPVMVVDIGTNGEVILGDKDRMFTASCAAGGAYEGATAKSGVGAIEGAISNIRIVNGRAEYETIGDKPAVGICGSGLIDLLAELLRNGILDERGKFTTSKKEFVVEKDRNIRIAQEDVHQLMLARSGMSLDQKSLIRYYETTVDGLDKIYLAGAFGNYINADNAIAIGLLPDAKEKVVKIGNGALAGARQMLLSQEKRSKAEEIVEKIQHTKPNEEEGFFDAFVDGLCFGKWR
jgi:uncharacterized 2Fe-2S/4Fe-4S cluster protein (DUF4445 family)